VKVSSTGRSGCRLDGRPSGRQIARQPTANLTNISLIRAASERIFLLPEGVWVEGNSWHVESDRRVGSHDFDTRCITHRKRWSIGPKDLTNTMSDYVWKHLPYAIYLDTNALRSAGSNLDAAWINELLSITNEYGISVCISELALAEWCEHLIGVLEANRGKLLSAIGLLRHYGISVPDIKADQISLPKKGQFIEMVSDMMKAAGFDVIPNWDAPLSQLLGEAVVKRPPFDEGGKGLCDAVILESYAEHAKKNFAQARVLVVSNDGAVKLSEERFKDREIAVEFVGQSDIVGKVKSLLNDELAAYLEQKKSRLKDYVLTYEQTVLDYVRKTPLAITDWMLNPPLAGSADRIWGTIKGILSVRPVRITNVIGGTPPYGEQTAQDRYPVRISVEIEIDVVINEYDFGLGLFGQTRAIVQPSMVDSTSPVILERTLDWKPREINETIKRSLTVLATLDAEKKKLDILDDFRIEKVV
jgi:hypothetical protein